MSAAAARIAEVMITDPIQRFGNKSYFSGWWCHCPINVVELVVIIANNGSSQYRPRCIHCGFLRKSGGLPHRLLTASERAHARIIRVNEPKPAAQCERCGKWGEVEIHHWAPRARFPDFAEWPTSALCRECHVRWHQGMEGGAS